jgi:NADH-quinone oxidoreductase subunit C
MELRQALQQRWSDSSRFLITQAGDELTFTIPACDAKRVLTELKRESPFRFEMLMDLCAVDYLHYGLGEWETTQATAEGFERARAPIAAVPQPGRFAVVYHLLSLSLEQRLRVKVFLKGDPPVLPSVVDLWPCANWYEREAFDLFGVFFSDHPDLRRLLTDYGFIGHPFRKDFPVSGHVEVRYDAAQGRVIYEPIDLVPRVLVPKVVRFATKVSSEEGAV